MIANIYLGKITQWDDPAIKALNPRVNLPSTKITPVFRSDGSGTTYNFTDYLSRVSPAFKSKVGNSTAVTFPAGIGGRGSSGLAGVVKNTEGGIGYVDIAYALANKIKFASVRNSAGKFITPGLRGDRGGGGDGHDGPGEQRDAHRQPAEGPTPLAYPICTFSYVLLPTKTDKAPELRKFVFYALTQGQKFGPRLLFVPIPNVVLVASEKTLKQVQA